MLDGFVKSRHSDENRSPVGLNSLKELDSGFRRNDRKACFPNFYGVIKFGISLEFGAWKLRFLNTTILSVKHSMTDFNLYECPLYV